MVPAIGRWMVPSISSPSLPGGCAEGSAGCAMLPPVLPNLSLLLLSCFTTGFCFTTLPLRDPRVALPPPLPPIFMHRAALGVILAFGASSPGGQTCQKREPPALAPAKRPCNSGGMIADWWCSRCFHTVFLDAVAALTPAAGGAAGTASPSRPREQTEHISSVIPCIPQVSHM
jgi:hypothetical protein